MTADRLDLDALEASVRQKEALFLTNVMVGRETVAALIARARDRDLHEALIDAARRHRDDALALVEGLRRTCSRLRADRDAALTGVATRDNLLRMQGEELARVVAERDAARAALARVTDEAMIERIEDALASHFEQEVHAAYAARATIEAIRAVTGEGQEVAHD